MKKTISKVLVMVAMMMALCVTTVSAQSYNDMIGNNPNAEADIKIVSDYLTTLIDNGDVDKAASMLTTNFMGYGPGPQDSANLQITIDIWKKNVAVQENRKVNFVAETFNVKSGVLAGNWVSVWGNYSCSQNGKDLKFPFQYTAHVSNGKIDQDRVYYDQLYIIKALGYSITPPSN